MFSKHYQGELGYLRAMGKAFAQVNPSIAGLLAERGGDPDVERLLEGFAFLSARIRERSEDCVPEVIHDLTEILLPHYLRPIPACSIVEFQPVAGALRTRVTLQPETELATAAREGTQCLFRTSAAVDLLPLQLRDVLLDSSTGAAPVLRVRLEAAQPALPAIFQEGGIRFFIHGDLPLASTLLLWIARHLRSVQVRGLSTGRATTLRPQSVRVAGFDPSLPLLPWPTFAPPGYRTLQEYFALPQKFLFFEVRGLDAVAAPEEQFELALQFERPPELPARVGRDTLRLNCVPVVNLFRTTADPIPLHALGAEHLVRAAELPPGQMEIYSVDSATGIPEGTGPRIAYRPFFAFGHGATDTQGSYYRLRRRLSPIDDGIDTFLSATRPADEGPGPEPHVLSLDVTCTNRSLPAQLQLGDISLATAGSPTLATFRNIVAVTRPVRPPLGSELHWRLLAHLAAGRSSVTDAAALRTLLDLYNLQGAVDLQSGRANGLRVEGIRQVEATAARRLLAGAPVRGTRMAIELEEDHFASAGDAFLFASVVDEVLAARASLNTFCELAVRLQPSQRAYSFPARSGARVLL